MATAAASNSIFLYKIKLEATKSSDMRLSLFLFAKSFIVRFRFVHRTYIRNIIMIIVVSNLIPKLNTYTNNGCTYNKHSFVRIPLILLLIWYGLYRIRTNKDIFSFDSRISFYLYMTCIEWGLRCLTIPLLPIHSVGRFLDDVFSHIYCADQIRYSSIAKTATCRNEFRRPIKLIIIRK